MASVACRDVDKLDSMPDNQILLLDQQYLVKHSLDQLFAGLLKDVLTSKPADPLQYIIDSLSLGPDLATQDADTGLPHHRKEKLLQVFKIIDKEGNGKISLRMLQSYASKHGGETLTLEDLKGLFQDFKPNENYINQQEFLRFFARVSGTITNKEFEAMIEEMQG